MKSFVEKLLSNELVEAKSLLDKRINELFEEKIEELKVQLVADMFGEVEAEVELEEGNVTKMGRTKLIKVRVRKGKIQRLKKFSAAKGYTIRGGKLTRMMPAEIRHREIAAKRSQTKKRAKLTQTLRKRRISLRKRRAMGV